MKSTVCPLRAVSSAGSRPLQVPSQAVGGGELAAEGLSRHPLPSFLSRVRDNRQDVYPPAGTHVVRGNDSNQRR